MKIVVVKTPKLLTGIFRLVFKSETGRTRVRQLNRNEHREKTLWSI